MAFKALKKETKSVFEERKNITENDVDRNSLMLYSDILSIVKASNEDLKESLWSLPYTNSTICEIRLVMQDDKHIECYLRFKSNPSEIVDTEYISERYPNLKEVGEKIRKRQLYYNQEVWKKTCDLMNEEFGDYFKATFDGNRLCVTLRSQ